MAEDDPNTETTTASVADKWYMIGIGGAGNHLLDTFLLRRDHLRDRNPSLARAWQGALAGYASLNTNVGELAETYYVSDDRPDPWTDDEIYISALINQKGSTTGVGRKPWEGTSEMEEGLEDDPIGNRWAIDPTTLKDAQGVLLLHSVTKGTGSGATPTLAWHLREEVVGWKSPMVSAVVIPDEQTQKGVEKSNALIGLGEISRPVNGIIPFDNEKLQESTLDLAVDITDLGSYAPGDYTEINKVVAAFFECFNLCSNPDTARDATQGGEVFDIKDSYGPIEGAYPYRPSGPDWWPPAVVMAPVMHRSLASDLDRSALENLARSTLSQGRLARFDPTTAWGCHVVLFGPPDKMEPGLDDVLEEVLADPDLLAGEVTKGSQPPDINASQYVVPHVDHVYLWGVLWNPKMPAIESMIEQTEEQFRDAGSERGYHVDQSWDAIETWADHLGRENMP